MFTRVLKIEVSIYSIRENRGFAGNFQNKIESVCSLVMRLSKILVKIKSNHKLQFWNNLKVFLHCMPPLLNLRESYSPNKCPIYKVIKDIQKLGKIPLALN